MESIFYSLIAGFIILCIQIWWLAGVEMRVKQDLLEAMWERTRLDFIELLNSTLSDSNNSNEA